MPYSFIYFKSQKNNIVNLFVTNNTLLYVIIHIKFSSLFYTSQLSDMFAYELPLIGTNRTTTQLKKVVTNPKSTVQPSVVVYNFHSMFYHNRIFLFSQHNHNVFDKKIQNTYYTLNSIAELFPAGNWLERENSELHGVNFLGKKDLRNLMLQYGDSSTPFNKAFPSIGTNELVYNPINDTINQVPITVQL
jgi:NADH:ubiquinone oxidoreductase subunit C